MKRTPIQYVDADPNEKHSASLAFTSLDCWIRGWDDSDLQREIDTAEEEEFVNQSSNRSEARELS